MKIFKMLSLAAAVLFAVACNNGNEQDTPKVGNFDAIENEWKLVSVDGVANEFTVYIKFDAGSFAMYQQVYTWDYVFFEGEYSIDGGVLSGSYFDGNAWKTSYTGGVSADGNTLTLKSKDQNPITCIYEACTIPEEVISEAHGEMASRAMDVVPFL